MTLEKGDKVKGDLWEVRCGDWRVYALEEVDHIITDPPYSDHVHDLTHRRNPEGDNANFEELDLSFDAIAPELLVDALMPLCRRWFLSFCSMEHVGAYAEAADASDHGRWVKGMIWLKVDSTPSFSGRMPGMWGESIATMHSNKTPMNWNAGGKRGYYNHNVCRKDRVHETQKPVPLMVELIEDFTDPGEVVLDPYGGSMTTGVACVITGRRFIGCEINPDYAEVGIERLRAAESGNSLQAHRAKQSTLFDL